MQHICCSDYTHIMQRRDLINFTMYIVSIPHIQPALNNSCLGVRELKTKKKNVAFVWLRQVKLYRLFTTHKSYIIDFYNRN